ncbi:hypothetical protein FRX31_026827 [Thalictrum thalictroides]|uniref:RNase H type-1 domain-containing protein n=1 Tax=Thalictrum thalictroides TaxID=46969 RepID=A0A7J6VFQ2_THATH|nr:hypothetical protein FRX31_026827 [Thalictrum thalictroides]
MEHSEGKALESRQSPQQLSSSSHSHLSSISSRMVTSKSVSWEPPPAGWIKINFDASFDVYSKSGVVAKDHESIILAESLAIELTIFLALNFNLVDIILEGDNQNVISNLSGVATMAYNVRSVLRCCKMRVSNLDLGRGWDGEWAGDEMFSMKPRPALLLVGQGTGQKQGKPGQETENCMQG